VARSAPLALKTYSRESSHSRVSSGSASDWGRGVSSSLMPPSVLGPSYSAQRESAKQNKRSPNGSEGGGLLLPTRGENCMRLSLLGSANLVRPGLRPYGPSDMASRHRRVGRVRMATA